MTIRYPRELREAALRDILSKTLTLKEVGEKYTVWEFLKHVNSNSHVRKQFSQLREQVLRLADS